MVELSEGVFARRSVSLTGAAAFGGMAAVTTLTIPPSIQLPFPILPFLKFDVAELFSVLAFLLFGPIPALITATVHWAFLSAVSTTGPLGPTVKFASVLSTLFGLLLGSRIYAQIASKLQHRFGILSFMIGSAMFLRVVILIVVNYFVFTFIGPVIFGIDYLGFSQQVLQVTLGWQFASGWALLTAMLLLTSVFNALHAVFSVAIPYLLFTPLSLKIPEIASGHPWISRFTSK